MKKRLTTFTTALILITPLLGDTITLKDGTQFEGTIRTEVDGLAMVTVDVNKNIKEERIIKKSDILTVIKNSSEASEYKALAELIPTPDNWTDADYKRAITKEIDPYLNKYKTSPFHKKAQELKDTLTSERSNLNSGSVKIDGKWFTKSEQEKDQIEFDSVSDFENGIKLAKAGRFAQALNILDKFTTVYANTSNSTKAIDARNQTLAAFEKQLRTKLVNHKELVSANKAKLKSMSRQDAREVRNEMKAAASRYKDFVSKQKKDKNNRWLSINDLHKSQMTRNLKLIETEKSKGIATVANAADAYRKAYIALDTKDLKTAESELKILKSIDHTDEYYTPLAAKLQVLKKEQVEMKKAERKTMLAAKKAARKEAKAMKEAKKKTKAAKEETAIPAKK